MEIDYDEIGIGHAQGGHRPREQKHDAHDGYGSPGESGASSRRLERSETPCPTRVAHYLTADE